MNDYQKFGQSLAKRRAMAEKKNSLFRTRAKKKTMKKKYVVVGGKAYAVGSMGTRKRKSSTRMKRYDFF